MSERPKNFDYTPEAHAEALAEFVDAVNLRDFTLVVHDFGGPIGLPLCLRFPDRVRALVLLNTWMWSFSDDPEMQKRARLVEGTFGRLLYRYANASLRLIMPSAYGNRRKLTRQIHRQYLAPFPDPDSRGRVLWSLARSLRGSSAFYDSLWKRRTEILRRPTLVLWGMRDSAFRPHQLARWKKELSHAQVVELPDAGHWPHEEAPETVAAELQKFLTQSRV